jgi:hypothetical protein
MKKENYSEETTENLIKKRKIMVGASSALAGMLLVLFAITIYISAAKGFTALSIIPFALSPILVINFKQVKAIDEELKSRNT